MLLFNEKLLKVRRINQVVIPVYTDEDKSEDLVGYIYSDLGTYRQATLLMVRFEATLEPLISALGITNDKLSYINYFADAVPQPFKMFAPFLGLIDFSEKLKEDLEDLINHLHMVSRAISFSDFVSIPKAARINVTFTKTNFLTMKEEIKDYEIGLYEAEMDESPDGVYWISSEEINRVGKIITALDEAMGGMSIRSANQIAKVAAEERDLANDIGKSLEKENADFEDTFDPDEWADFKPQTFASDFGSLGGGGSDNTVVNKEPVQTTSTSNGGITEDMLSNDDDEMDFLMAMATTGAERTNNMIGG